MWSPVWLENGEKSDKNEIELIHQGGLQTAARRQPPPTINPAQLTVIANAPYCRMPFRMPLRRFCYASSDDPKDNFFVSLSAVAFQLEKIPQNFSSNLITNNACSSSSPSLLSRCRVLVVLLLLLALVHHRFHFLFGLFPHSIHSPAPAPVSTFRGESENFHLKKLPKNFKTVALAFSIEMRLTLCDWRWSLRFSAEPFASMAINGQID